MLGLSLMIVAITLFTLVDGKHRRTPLGQWPRDLPLQKQVDHGAALVKHTFPKLPKLAVTHIAGSKLRQSSIPEITHTKKPGQGYAKGSPLYEKQQKQKSQKATEMLLPPSPSGRQRPTLTVIMGCMFAGVMVVVIAACVNRDFLVRRQNFLDGREMDISPPPIKPEFDMRTSSTRYDLNPRLQPGRAQIEYVDPIPRSTRLDATLPPAMSVSMMPSKQQEYPPMQRLGAPAYESVPATVTSPPGSQGALPRPAPQAVYGSMPPQQPGSYLPQRSYESMPANVNSPPGSQGVIVPRPASPMQSIVESPSMNNGPQAAIYASMPPQQPGSYLPPQRSYSTMPPVIN